LRFLVVYLRMEDLEAFIDWIAQECKIYKCGDPWSGDEWKNWFFYNDEQMTPDELIEIYKELNAK
jgi:hypothetical protein